MVIQIKKSEKAEATTDTLGGFKVYESDAYEAVVKMAYMGTAKSGAQFIGLQLTLQGDKEYREDLYFTNKDGENFYTKNNKDYILPGFQNIDELCLLTTGKGFEDQETEEKIVKLYDSTQKAETNQSVQVLSEVIGQPVIVGIKKETSWKQVKNDATGQYEDTNEKRDTNQINKFFHADNQATVTEARQELPFGVFFEEWVKANKGNTNDKTRGAAAPAGGGAKAGRPGAAGPASNAKPTQSLFNKG